MFFLLIFVSGLAIGSFLNVLIYRLPRNLSFFLRRSFCPKCKKKIAWYDNVPLLSFLILGGKCRHCRKKISARYPLVELLTGGLTAAVFWKSPSPPSSLLVLGYWLVLVWGLVVIFFIDLEHQIIPDEILIPLVIVSFLFGIISNFQILVINFLPTAVFSALFFLFLHGVTKGRGMGLGDVKLAFLIGLAFGFPKTVVAFYLAFLTGSVAGIILIIKGKVKFGQKIAFGPFLAIACVLTLFWSDQILWLVKSYF